MENSRSNLYRRNLVGKPQIIHERRITVKRWWFIILLAAIVVVPLGKVAADRIGVLVNGVYYLDIGSLLGGGGYTNLTSFIAQTAWRLFYSDGSGHVQELALGSAGTVLQAHGAAAAPTFEALTPDNSSIGTLCKNGSGVIVNCTNLTVLPQQALSTAMDKAVL